MTTTSRSSMPPSSPTDDEADDAQRLTARRGWIGAWLITLAALVFYLSHAILDYTRLLTTSYDLGIFDQAERAYAHFKAPEVPLKGSGVNIFGDHFHPIITVLAPLYWLWNTPVTLVVAQAFITAASVPVVYRFIERRAPRWLALMLTGAYAFGWPLQALIDFDFHAVAFATPLMALAIDALDRRKDRQLVLWCVLLLFVREDMGILVAFIGVLAIARRPRSWKLGIGFIAGGLAMYELATGVIIPHFSRDGFGYSDQFSALGDSVPDALLGMLIRPWHAAAVFFSPATKVHTLLLLFLPMLFLALRSRYVLLALPLLAERMFNSRHFLWDPYFHYNALPWVIIVLAAVDAMHRMHLFDPGTWRVRFRLALAAWLVIFPVALIPLGHKWGVLPVTQLRTGYHDEPSGWYTSAKKVLAFMPSDVCVAADNRLGPHLTSRDWVTVANAPTPEPDFYIVDLAAPDSGGNPPSPLPMTVLIQAQLRGFTVAFRAGTFYVLQNPHYTGPSAQCSPLGPGKSGPDKEPFPAYGHE